MEHSAVDRRMAPCSAGCHCWCYVHGDTALAVGRNPSQSEEYRLLNENGC